MVDTLGGKSATAISANSVAGHDGISLPRGTTTRRRRVRKGTRSCWECKRRKIRCVFASSDDTTCVGCRQRRATCVGQEMPEELSPAKKGNRFLGERISKVEDFVKDYLSVQDASAISHAEEPRQNGLSKFDTPTTHSDDAEWLTVQAPPTSAENLIGKSSPLPPGSGGVSSRAEAETTLQHLLAALPTEEDVKVILRECPRTSRYTELIYTQPHSKLTYETLAAPYPEAKPPRQNTHPILLAKCMLTFAITLQTPQTDKFLDLSEPKNTIMRRLMTAATMWVTTREEMHGTMESLICIILEGVFETNSGNLRRAWAVYRRAMAAAQLMGLHRTPIPPLNCIDSELDVKPEIIWFRIVHMDRYLSLLLGLPQGTSDKSIGAVSIWENEPPLSKFERLLTVIASRILERNDRSFSTAELTTTQSIDAELLKMSMSMPSSFWRPANFHGLTPGNPDAFLETIRLGAQVYYYGLLIQLHLPYMMRISSSTEHHYAKITCVNAGREILTRFNAHRRFNPLSSCSRPVDFFALLASMTLVLAHLDAQCHKEARNVLAHQRLSDRALLQEVLDRMDGMSSIDEDTIADQSAKLIRRLLKIEADATKGNSYTARSMTGDDGTLEGKGAGDELHLQIPYLGVIKIARQGPISREPPHDQTSQVEPSQILPLATPSEGFSSPSNAPPVSGPPLSLTDNIDQRCTISAYGQSMLQCPESNHNKTTLQPPSELPLVGTGVGDWAFQGVDMAFFDSLMKGTSCVDTSELDQEWIDDPLGMDSSHL